MSVKFANLVQLCERSCSEFKDRQLFGVKRDGAWTWITYREFGEMVDAFRGGVPHPGVGRGDVVGIVANNRVEWAVACYATYGLRAAFVPMYQEQLHKEWQFILTDCRAKVVIGATDAIAEKLRRMQTELPALQHVFGLELPASDDHSYAALLEIRRKRPVTAW